MSGRGGGIGIVSPAQSAAAAAGSIIPLKSEAKRS